LRVLTSFPMWYLGRMRDARHFVDDVPIRKGWRKLTRNEIAGMRNHYAAGVSIRRIAIAYGVDWSTVWRRCSDVRK
jgi:hypothetical protein